MEVLSVRMLWPLLLLLVVLLVLLVWVVWGLASDATTSKQIIE